MKIAFLTADTREVLKDYGNSIPEFGTAPTAVLQAFALLPDLEVHVVSCARARMNSPAKLAPNVFFHSLYVPKIGWMRTAYQGCIRAVRTKLKEIRPDIVHGQGTELDCALNAAFSGFPNVVTIHGNMRELARVFRAPIGSFAWLAARLEGFTLRRTMGVLCNSSHTERLVRPRTPRVWRVPNALREPFFAPLPPPDARAGRRCTLVNVGTEVGPRKRQLELLDVIRELRRQGLDFQFQFVGEVQTSTPYATAFREQVKPMEQEGFARCLGRKPVGELVGIFDAADAMVHFSPEESFGLVIVEALARDLKVFGARVGGVPDVTTGVPDVELFGVDDWSGLCSAIAGWIHSGFPRARGAAQVMRARYHPQVIAQRHLEIYREVLQRPS
jgi:glycosyltransferase involved in cell wall biosynthesis